MQFSHQQLVTSAGALKPHLKASKWWVAVSGGLDSMSLLHALVKLQEDHICPPLGVIHINHSLQLQADHWQHDVEKKCQQYGVVCISHKVTLSPLEQQQFGLEAAARNARYESFKQHLKVGEVLLLGQHADDQSETLFLRLLRGAGVNGLRAMPQQRQLGLGCLVRPLLHVRQTDLYAYAQAHNLTWNEDPSNQSHDFDRNYLRHQVMPWLRNRWPALDQQVAKVTSLMKDTQVLLDEVAAIDFKLIHRETELGGCISCADMQTLSQPRRYNVLRYWLHLQNVPMPDYAVMQTIDKDFILSAADRQPYMQLGGWCLRRHRGDLLLMLGADQSEKTAVNWSGSIDPKALSAGLISFPEGVLRIVEGAEWGLFLAQGDLLERRFRVGGERCKPLGRNHSQSLKKLLQEARVPAWERDKLPLFYVNGRLAMVADLWVNFGFEAAIGAPAWGWKTATKNKAFDCSD